MASQVRAIWSFGLFFPGIGRRVEQGRKEERVAVPQRSVEREPKPHRDAHPLGRPPARRQSLGRGRGRVRVRDCRSGTDFLASSAGAGRKRQACGRPLECNAELPCLSPGCRGIQASRSPAHPRKPRLPRTLSSDHAPLAAGRRRPGRGSRLSSVRARSRRGPRTAPAARASRRTRRRPPPPVVGRPRRAPFTATRSQRQEFDSGANLPDPARDGSSRVCRPTSLASKTRVKPAADIRSSTPSSIALFHAPTGAFFAVHPVPKQPACTTCRMLIG
jgi:hypothetical protein